MAVSEESRSAQQSCIPPKRLWNTGRNNHAQAERETNKIRERTERGGERRDEEKRNTKREVKCVAAGDGRARV